jgi:hypothetical protein
MIFIIAIVGPFSGLKDQVDQNELGKEHQAEKASPRTESGAISQTRGVFSFSARIRSAVSAHELSVPLHYIVLSLGLGSGRKNGLTAGLYNNRAFL